jgi:transposase-like protein
LRLTAELEKLTPHQKQILTDWQRAAGHAQVVWVLVENRVTSMPTCTYCGHEHVKTSHWGSAAGLQRYLRVGCKATFTALADTPLARLWHKDKWLTYAWQMTEGLSVRKSAEACEVHRNTVFRWRHRFLEPHNEQRPTRLASIAEADETAFLESFKGKKRGLPDEQIPILICRDRAGCKADFALDKADKEHIGAVFKPILAVNAILCTDGDKALGGVAREMGIIVHRPVNLARGIRMVADVYHVQNGYVYDSRLKEWMRRFHGVATHYLTKHLGWRKLIERSQNALLPPTALLAALGFQVQQLTVT